jgi:hypothetical protein
MTHCNECGDLIPIMCYCHTCYVQLETENARLREALEAITTYAWESHNPQWPATIARDALREVKE